MINEEFLYSIYSNKRLSLALKMTSHFVVVFSFFVYACFLHEAHMISPLLLLKSVCVSGGAFFLVTFLRKWIGAPRPYDVYAFFDSQPKTKKGASFPSRHTFSVFCIGTLVIPIMPIFGALTLILGAMLAISRVALGLHFVRDVLAGAVIGVFAGVLGAFASGMVFIA